MVCKTNRKSTTPFAVPGRVPFVWVWSHYYGYRALPLADEVHY